LFNLFKKHFMNNQSFTIKITGGGTPLQIASALMGVAQGLIQATEEPSVSTEETLDGANWEDPILFTEISLEETEDESEESDEF